MAVRIIGEKAVDLFQDFQRRGLALLALVDILMLVVPNQILETLVTRQIGIRVELFYALAKLIVEPRVRPTITRRLGGLMMELQHSLRVRESPFKLSDLRGRQVEYFSFNIRCLDLAI